MTAPKKAMGIFLVAYKRGGLNHAIDVVCTYISRQKRNVPVWYGKILTDVSKRHGVSVAELLHDGKGKRLINARREVAQDLRDRGWSYPDIGRVLKRHHTTVMNLLKKPARAAEETRHAVCQD